MESSSVSFRVNNKDLTNAVAWVARSLPSKPAQPVLRGMVITATDQGLEIAGYDYEVSTKVTVSAEVLETGRFAVAGKLMADICNTLPDQEVEVTVDESKAVVTCSHSLFELPLIPLDDYPDFPKLPSITGKVNPDLFTEAVNQVATAAGKDDTLPMLTGVYMEFKGNQLLMAATDRFRLAVRTIDWNPEDDNVDSNLLIPAKTLLEHARSLDPSADEDVTIAAGGPQDIESNKMLGLTSSQRQTTTSLLEANFPNFRPLIPKSHTSMATVELSALSEALRRVSLVAQRASIPQVRLEFDGNKMILSAGSSEFGHAEEPVECAYVGSPVTTAFNPAFLKAGLSVIRGQRAVFGFTEGTRPALLMPEPEEMPEADEQGVFPRPVTDFCYLLMPVRIPG